MNNISSYAVRSAQIKKSESYDLFDAASQNRLNNQCQILVLRIWLMSQETFHTEFPVLNAEHRETKSIQ